MSLFSLLFPGKFGFYFSFDFENLVYIRDLLGHVSVTTTEIYLRVNTETKRKALESAYVEVVTQDVPLWQEDTDLLSWLEDFCR